jgi:Tol biopolymer transport system component
MSQSERPGVDRRRLMSMGGTAIAATTLAPSGVAAQVGRRKSSTRDVTITEGTNIAVSASPDGQTLAFDLYGVIWTLPIAGGVAKRLTDDLTDGAQPDWSPDGKRLVFQSYRDGTFQVWTVGADGSGLTQHTRGPFDCREPRFSPDGRSIAYGSDRTGAYAIHVMDLATGATRVWASANGQACEPAWSPDGRRIAFAVDRARIEIVDANGARETGVSIRTSNERGAPAELRNPAFTPDGKGVVCHILASGRTRLQGPDSVLVEGEDIFPFRPAWLPGGDLIYAAGGKIRRRTPAGVTTDIPFSLTVPIARPNYRKRQRDYDSAARKPVIGIGSPALSPDGTQAVFRALNALWLLTLGGKAARLVSDGFWVCDPAWSPDGKTLAYSTDRAGTLDIWLRDMTTGAERQLTRHKDAALSAAWSRDGKTLAFLDQNGSLHTVDVERGDVRQVFGAIWEPGKPSWSADGKTLALAAFKPYSGRFREGLSEILTVDVATGAAAYQPVFPDKSLGTRGDDGPVWSPDGKAMAFVFASRLWVAPVNAKGAMTAPPKALNTEVTDAPTWSGDSRTLLYLCNGALRTIDAAGGKPATVPHGITWANAKPKGRVVIRGGRVWQGLSSDVRTGADIVVVGNRIADLVAAGTPVGDARVIEARDATVIPGLVEMHAHRQMQGYGYGDREGRLWLSLGVTTSRSPGSPAYHMVEDREALDAGVRMGPRYFATGEAIDGSRIYYNFMRPVTEPGQMALELSRAKALSYDLLKSYVRQPLQDQRDITAWAHAQGIPVTGHYHYPALAFGLDGMEHIGATSRTGYSRTVSQLGVSYQDVTALFAASGARRTPTLFTSSALYGTDRSLVDDPRTKALYPPWEYARLLQRAAQAASSDNTAPLASLAANVAHLRAILDQGGRVVTGTDSPIDFNGVSLHMNLRAMVRYGMTPAEALTTATRYAGEFLDQPLGVIAPGMLADMVVAQGDPLTRIEDAAAVRYVIKNGEVYDMPAILGPFAAMKTAETTPVRIAARAPAPGLWWHEAGYVESGRAACCLDPFCAVDTSGRRIFRAEAV